jgi:hypothetical protein
VFSSQNQAKERKIYQTRQQSQQDISAAGMGAFDRLESAARCLRVGAISNASMRSTSGKKDAGGKSKGGGVCLTSDGRRFIKQAQNELKPPA